MVHWLARLPGLHIVLCLASANQTLQDVLLVVGLGCLWVLRTKSLQANLEDLLMC